ncbi:MAG TPA: hypothetical protein PKE38_09985 [Ignavibacteriaceae bacterium]|nr:hypothetical protein [Ignavibacteriaceae bacterium]
MKKLNRLFLFIIIILTSLAFNSCNPFDDVYLTLSLDLDFSVQGFLSNISIPAEICLSDFEDYDDNRDNLEEIKYISAAFLTLAATDSLAGDNLKLTLYQADRSTMLFQYTKARFTANDYLNAPLEIVLSEQEKSNINNYLKDPQVDKCFYATLELSNITFSGIAQSYSLNSKMEFLTQLKVKP